jgi:hypothetical membrane protein
MSRRSNTRLTALGGIVGPAAFVAAWVTGGATKDGYSPVHDAISRLAAVGASTRPLMTAGFVVFGTAVPVYAAALRRSVPGVAWITATITGLSTLAVAAAPLDHSSTVDSLHALFAGIGYLTLAATPLLAARPLLRAGQRTLARTGLVAGGIAATSLALTVTGLPTGLFQRVGLTAGDVWLVATAVAMLTNRLPSQGRPPGSVERGNH